MALELTENRVQEYRSRGYTIFREFLSTGLLSDLRRSAEQARRALRDAHGPQAHALLQIARFDLDLQPFVRYAEFPGFQDAVHDLIGSSARPASLSLDHRFSISLFFEPQESPFCTPWHRDFRDTRPDIDLRAWTHATQDPECCNQVNCPLYDDSSLWVVPGSHARRDSPEEIRLFPDRPIHAPELDGMTNEDRERVCRAYCQCMPGAVELHLNSGDLLVYRNCLWHAGNYVPYRRRATIHHTVETPMWLSWISKYASQRPMVTPELEWPNPNEESVTLQELRARELTTTGESPSRQSGRQQPA